MTYYQISSLSSFNEKHQKEIDIPLSSINGEGCSPEGPDLLSVELERLPFKFYQCFLVVCVLVVPLGLYFVFSNLWFWIKFYNYPVVDIHASADIASSISFTSLLFGSIGMMHSLDKRKSRIAQHSYVVFQLSVMASVLAFLFITNDISLYNRAYSSKFRVFFVCTVLIVGPIVCLGGGFAVLRVFKKNHPLNRLNLCKISEDTDPLIKEFVEQNEAIASELAKYDKQLKRWPYLIYKWCLRLSALYNILLFFGFLIIAVIMDKMTNIFILTQAIILSFAALLIAFCCIFMDVVMRTKVLAQSTKAIFYWKICMIVAIFACLLGEVRTYLYPNSFKRDNNALKVAFFINYVLIPMFNLIGALHIHKKIGKRDQFARLSSYDDESYL